MKNLLFTEFNTAHCEIVSSSLHLLMMGKPGADKITMREVYDSLFTGALSPMGANDPVPVEQLHSAIQIFLCNDIANDTAWESAAQKFQLSCVERVYEVNRASGIDRALSAARYCLERNQTELYSLHRKDMLPEFDMITRAGARTAWQLVLSPTFDMEMRTGVAYKAVRYYAFEAAYNLFWAASMISAVTSARKAIAIYKAADAAVNTQTENTPAMNEHTFVDTFQSEWEKEIRVQAGLLKPFGNPFTD